MRKLWEIKPTIKPPFQGRVESNIEITLIKQAILCRSYLEVLSERGRRTGVVPTVDVALRLFLRWKKYTMNSGGRRAAA